MRMLFAIPACLLLAACQTATKPDEPVEVAEHRADFENIEKYTDHAYAYVRPKVVRETVTPGSKSGYYANGRTAYTIALKDGKPVPDVRFYYDDGLPLMEAIEVVGTKERVIRIWDRESRLDWLVVTKPAAK